MTLYALKQLISPLYDTTINKSTYLTITQSGPFPPAVKGTQNADKSGRQRLPTRYCGGTTQ